MKDFAFARPADAPQAVAALARPGTAIVAGGTELLNWIRLGIAAPDRLVDIGGLDALEGITIGGAHLTIGARTTLATIGRDPLVARHASALAQACLKAASAQIRNRATIGGNLLQKTRCAYFRAEAPLPWGCNKRVPGSGCAAHEGINDRHAIFGWTDACVATHPSDPAVALACLDAELELLGPHGRRRLPLTGFHLTQQEAGSAGEDTARTETRLAPDEMIVACHLPLRPGARSAYLKVRERESYEYALVSAAASVERDGDRIAVARIALGSVAQRPWRLVAAEAALAGRPLRHEAIAPIVVAAMAEARPLTRNGYKVTMAANAATRALLQAGGAS